MEVRTSALNVDRIGHGRPLVLLHGWGLHAGLFAPLAADLAHGRAVLAVDLPGHGRSAAPAEWTLAAVVEVLDRELGDDAAPPDVLGWSLGGVLALAWARARPKRVRRLVLVSATPRFSAGADWAHGVAAQTLARFADELRVAYRTTLLRFLALQVQGSEAGHATLAVLRHALFERGTPDPSVLSDALRALVAADLRADVPRLAHPALVIAGSRDTLVPPAASRWLAHALPDARHVEIEGAAHAPFLSHRAAFAHAVTDFLR